MMHNREKASQIIQGLKEKYKNKASSIQDANEAKTRLLIIDEVLIALGWEKEDFNPEVHAGKAGYIDYLLAIDKTPRLIVEAKKTGNTFCSPTKKRLKETYQLRQFRSAFKAPFTSVIEQASRYANETGVPFALLTNGAEWVLVQLLLTPGFHDINDLRGFYFGNIFSDKFNFELFWDLLAKQNVDDGSVELNLAEKNIKEADFIGIPHTNIAQTNWKLTKYEKDLREFYDLFFDDLIDPRRRSMLEKCFVTDSRLDQFDGELKSALRDTTPQFVSNAREIAPGEGEELIVHKTGDRKGRVVIVTGSVGCGKSTFVTRSLLQHQHHMEHEDNLTFLRIDLIDEVAKEPKDISSLMWEYISDKWKDIQPDSYHAKTLKKIYGRELSDLRKGPYEDAFKQDSFLLAKKEAELLVSFTNKPEKFFKSCWRYYQDRGEGIVVFFDNVDRASELYQEQTYAFAHKLARETGVTVIVTMREFTFFRGREAGFLDVRTDDIVFHLQSPNLEQIIAKRVQYIEKYIEDDFRIPEWKKARNWDEFYKTILKYSSVLKSVFLTQQNGRDILSMLGAVAWHDVRYFLSIVKDTHLMLGSEKNIWTTSEVVASLLAPTSRGKPIVGNLYRPAYPNYQCYFLKIRIICMLQYGQRQYESRGGTKLNIIIRFLNQYGYLNRWIMKSVEELVQERFLECLEAPVAEDFTKEYELSKSHSFRPSPLAVKSIKEIVKDPVYLAFAGSDLPFHNEHSFKKYEKVSEEFVEMLMDQGLDRTAVELLAETDAGRIVAAYMLDMLESESPSESLTKYMPEIANTEREIIKIKEDLKDFAKVMDLPSGTPQQRTLFEQLSFEISSNDSGEKLIIPSTMKSATIGRSELAPMIFWALVYLRIRGKDYSNGVEITQIINQFLVDDYDTKAPNNVSRTLRNSLLKEQEWLLTKKITARQTGFRVVENWQPYWENIFGEPAPEIG